MYCSNCGAEIEGEVCPVCGMKMPQTYTQQAEMYYGNQPNQQAGMYYNGQPNQQAGMYYNSQPNQQAAMYYENSSAQQIIPDYGNQPQKQKKKSKAGLIIGFAAGILVLVIAAVIIYFKSDFYIGPKESERLVNEVMTAYGSINDADIDNVLKCIYESGTGTNMVTDMIENLEYIESIGIHYSFDYEIQSIEKADKDTIEDLCDNLYEESKVSDKIKSAFVCKTEYTISYTDETRSDTENLSFVCYKKGDKWYIYCSDDNGFECGELISSKLVDQFMSGIEEADTDKIVSLVDSKCVSDNDIETLSSSFEVLQSMGVEYTIDYKITSSKKADEEDIKDVCETLYNDASEADKINCAYICDVDFSITMSYLGETETGDNKMSLICYEKEGKWYIGGTVEN